MGGFMTAVPGGGITGIPPSVQPQKAEGVTPEAVPQSEAAAAAPRPSFVQETPQGMISKLSTKLVDLCTTRIKLGKIREKIDERTEELTKTTDQLSKLAPEAKTRLSEHMIHLHQELTALKASEDEIINSEWKSPQRSSVALSLLQHTLSGIDLLLKIKGGATGIVVHVLSASAHAIGLASGSVLAIYGGYKCIEAVRKEREVKQVLDRTTDELKEMGGDVGKPTPAPAKPTLASTCIALKRAFLEKKAEILTQEQRKQIAKICHFSLVVTIGLLSIAAATTAIVLSGGTLALPIFLGFFIPFVLLGTGMVTMGKIAGYFEKKEKLEMAVGLTEEVKESTGIRRPEDLLKLSNKICTDIKDVDERRTFLKNNFGIDVPTEDGLKNLRNQINEKVMETQGEAINKKKKQELQEEIAHLEEKRRVEKERRNSLDSEEGIASLLVDHFSTLFPIQEGAEIRHLLHTYSIDHFTTPEDLATDIRALEKLDRGKLLTKLGIEKLEDLEDSLDKQFSYLFPKEIRQRDALFALSSTKHEHGTSTTARFVPSTSTAKNLAEIMKRDVFEAQSILYKLGIEKSLEWVERNKDSFEKILSDRFGYLFPDREKVLDILDEWGIELPIDDQQITNIGQNKQLLLSLGINPNLEDKEKKKALEDFFKEIPLGG